ncbi:MAG TPA: protein phosphatase 2C domain-containing protein [Ktedonobacteraceae bacterium]
MAFPLKNTDLDVPPANTYMLTTGKQARAASNPALALEVGFRLDPGIRRKSRPNEDMVCVRQEIIPSTTGSLSVHPFTLLAVADGMGGQGHGQQASQLAVKSLIEYIEQAINSTQKTPESLASLLKAGVQYANRAVYEQNQRQSTDMGTTMTAVLAAETTAYVAHVGDSRLYSYRPSTGLVQITHDHSLVALLVSMGTIAPDDIYTHPARNQIYRSLGSEARVDIDTFSIPLATNDILLLCSDGLWEMVRDNQIASILTTKPSEPTAAAQTLIQAALKGGGADNVSVVVAHVIGA